MFGIRKSGSKFMTIKNAPEELPVKTREEREAFALRTNLRRRKDQQRALALEAEARKAAQTKV